MPLGIVFTALTAVIIWGATPVAAKVAVATLSPLAVVFFRMALGGLVALPLALSFKISLPKTWDQKVLLLLSGFCGFVSKTLPINRIRSQSGPCQRAPKK